MNKAQYTVSREDLYSVLKIWNQYNILEDIKCGPYSKKSPIRRDLDKSTSNVLIPLDSWTSGLLVYKLPLSGASVSVMPLSTYLNLGLGELAHTKLTVELADRTMKYPKVIAENALVGIGKFVFPIDFIILDMPEDVKVLLILGRPFFSTAHAKIDVFKRKITLRVGLRERMELDLEARLMGETLVLNRSLDPFFEDYIELNDLNVPLELRRDQVDDLMPTIEEGEVIEEFRARNDARMVSKFFRYPSDCDHDKKIRIDCAHNLKFSCMIDFVLLEDMDAYRDEGMGDVIFGEPFLREFGINARRFEGMITIHNGPRCKEIDKVGKVSTIWKSRSVGVLKLQDGCSTHNLAHKINMENLPSKISWEFLIRILLFPVFNLVLLVQSYNCLFRVSAAGTKLQLLKDYNCSRIKTAEKIKID
ncbi:putative reverse transcriptase domain-containing protein [Tanacetum coccineum]